MQDQVNTFLEHLEVERNLSSNTVVAYRNDLGQFLSYLQALDPAHLPRGWGNVTRDHIIGYMLDMREREYSDSTVARKIAAVKAFFAFEMVEGILSKDPSAAIESPKVEKHLPATLTPDEVELLLSTPSPTTTTGLRDRALLELMYATGLRVSEVVALDLADIDLDAATVRCLGKGKKERVLPIYAQALEVMKHYVRAGRPDFARPNETEQPLFLNRRGQRLTRQGLWLIIKGYVEQAGIPAAVTPHTLRHSFATHMLRGGAGLREVQQMMGHASISTTQVYTQVTRDHLRSAYDEAHPRA
ncbi:MAG: site-specific tyrosine recombinase XerD [Caldilineales bacterium]|nr:site-specific tyrosine recombinase XerD [Caldilineales bacterium]